MIWQWIKRIIGRRTVIFFRSKPSRSWIVFRAIWLTPRRLRGSDGFTLIEVLVVVAITALVSSYVLTYTSVGRSQVLLEFEQQKIAGFIFRAKSLAIATYNGLVPSRCGYGFAVDYGARYYSVFSYVPPPALPGGAPNCRSIDTIDERYMFFVSSSSIPSSIVLRNNFSDSLYRVLFVPPLPRVLISTDPSGAVTSDGGKVYIETGDGRAQRAITVSPAGQIDF